MFPMASPNAATLYSYVFMDDLLANDALSLFFVWLLAVVGIPLALRHL